MIPVSFKNYFLGGPTDPHNTFPMAKKSAGLLIYRRDPLQVLLVHPGGPFWKNKDAGAWSIPKGEFEADEDPLTAAIRETREETGLEVTGNFIPLTPIKQKSGKTVFAWAVEGNFDVSSVKSNVFEMEWPPKSGRVVTFPEVDRAEWFTMEEAKEKILTNLLPLLDELKEF